MNGESTVDGINNVPPIHLEDQMMYEFGRAVKRAKAILQKKFDEVRLIPKYESTFRREFSNLRDDINAVMKSRNNKGLDPHKLAAAACLAVLTARPLYVSGISSNAHSANELVAFLMAINIMQNYQAVRAVENVNKQKLLISKLRELDVPKLIYDTQPVTINTIIALRELSRMLAHSKRSADVALLLSSLFFFMDAHSFNKIVDVSKSL